MPTTSVGLFRDSFPSPPFCKPFFQPFFQSALCCSTAQRVFRCLFWLQAARGDGGYIAVELGRLNIGDPLACALSRPHGIFVDADGAVFIGDTDSCRVRVIL